MKAFLSKRLAGEGDVLRHLAKAGYRVQYDQHPRREVAFVVTNLAVDLRDGVRLCRLAELLTGEETA